jgi:hypothetical protein
MRKLDYSIVELWLLYFSAVAVNFGLRRDVANNSLFN